VTRSRSESDIEISSIVARFSISASAAIPLSRTERDQVAACATFIGCYVARCEPALAAVRADTGTRGSFQVALRAHGAAYLSLG
jgi:hypothetical protein